MALLKSSSTVGFLGLGNIGAPMASRLLAGGWNVTVFDVAAEKSAPFASEGAVVANSLEEVLACDVLVLAVPDDAATESVLSGSDGFFARGGEGRAVVVHSTILPATAQKLNAEASTRGVTFVDAPVSGGASRAITGELTLFLGATESAYDATRLLLESVASIIEHVGEPGAGAAVKLSNQMMFLAATGGVFEALKLAEAYGVGESTLLRAVGTSTGSSWVTQNWGFLDDTSAAYNEGGTPVRDRPWSKDLLEVLLTARAADLPMPIAGVLSQTVANYVEEHAHRRGADA